MGHGARGLQRRWDRLGVSAPRSRPLARLPVERGRPRWHLRPAPGAVPRPRAVERPRSDSQGAPVRPDRQRGQPRRGRQGVLLPSGFHADALVHADALQVPAGGVPVRRPGRGESTPRSLGAGVRADRHRRLRAGPLLRRLRRVRQGRCGGPADAGDGLQPRPRGGAAARAAHGLVPQHVVVERRCAQGRARGPSVGRRLRRGAGRHGSLRPALGLFRGCARAAVHRERDEHPAAVRLRQRHAVREGRHQRPCRAGPARRGQPGAHGNEGRRALRGRHPGRRLHHVPDPAVTARPGLAGSVRSVRRDRRASGGRRRTTSTHR